MPAAHLDGGRWSSCCSRASWCSAGSPFPRARRRPRSSIWCARPTALSGEITLDVKEGDLLPETYFYSRDDTRDGLLLRMKEAMDKTLDEAWRKRAAGLPLANRREALILASIIEKETAVPAERTKVAAVYINRLRLRMRLESDPTTIYGVTSGKGMQGRELTRADLQSNSPYNTYVVAGLPPGPICNPGRASILAAVATRAARPLALFRRRRPGRARLRDQRLRAQSQRRALDARSSAERRSRQSQTPSRAWRRPPAAPAAVPQAREPCRPCSWRSRCWRSWRSASSGSCAPILRRSPAGCVRSWSLLGGIGVGGLLIFGVRFLPGLLPELFGLRGRRGHGADRALRAATTARRLQLAGRGTAHGSAHGLPRGVDRSRHRRCRRHGR